MLFQDEDDVDSDDLKVESDVELDLDAPVPPPDSRSTTPVPFWLRTGDEVPPQLELPPSSDDLLVSQRFLFVVCAIPKTALTSPTHSSNTIQ